MDVELKVVLGLIMALLAVITIIGNLMTIVACIIDKRLRSVYNFYIFNLAIADLLIGCISVPVHAANTLADHCWLKEEAFCMLWYACITLCTQSALTLLFLSYDRLLLIKFAHRYPFKVTLKNAVIKIIISWIIACLVYASAILGMGVFAKKSVNYTPTVENITTTIRNDISTSGCETCNLEVAHSPEYTLIGAFLECVVPFKGLLIINGIIFFKIRRLLAKDVKYGNEIEHLHRIDTSDTQLEDKSTDNNKGKKKSPRPESGVLNNAYLDPTETEHRVSENTDKTELVADNENKVTPNIKNEVSDIENTDDNSRRVTTEQSDVNRLSGGTDDGEILVSVLGVIEKYGGGDSKSSTLSRQVKCSPSTSLGEGMDVIELESALNPSNPIGNDDGADSNDDAMDIIQIEPSLELSDQHSNEDQNKSEPDPNNGNEAMSVIELNDQEECETEIVISDDTESKTSTINEEVESEQIAENNVKEIHTEDTGDSFGQVIIASELDGDNQSVSSRIRSSAKAVSFLATLVFVFIICWSPYRVATLLISFCEPGQVCVDVTTYELLTWLLWVKSAINPFLYAYNNSLYRYHFKRFLSCGRKKFPEVS